MATHEQDPTAGPARAASRAPDTGGDENGTPAAAVGRAGPGDGGDDGTFRWPATGIPRFFGQHAGDHAGDDAEASSGAAAWAAAYTPAMPEPEPDPAPGPFPAQAEAPPGVAPPGVRPPAALSPAAVPADALTAGTVPVDDVPAGGGFRYGGPAGDGFAAQSPATQAGDADGFPQGYPGPWQYTGTAADSLTADYLLPGRGPAPESGWRRLLFQATAGRVSAPPSATERRRRDLVTRARTPVAGGHHRVAVLSLKGGVGKTTTVMGLGSTLASLRGDRVIALDANPDRGTLCDKLRLETAATVRDLLNERDQIRRYADVRAYTTQAASRLEVLASDRDPGISVAFSAEDYADVAQVLEHYYSICLTDCGTGLLHSAMAGALSLADQIVLVSTPSVDGARSASATMDWLAAHGYGDLVRGAVVVVSMVRRRSRSTVDIDRLQQHFAARCRAVVRVPYDAHLEEGAEVELSRLGGATADAYLALAAEVGDGFTWPRGVPRPSRGAR